MLELTFVRRYFFSPRSGSLVRTIGLMSFSGIFIGVFALVLVLSIMAGFNTTLKTRLLNVEPHLVAPNTSVEIVHAALAGHVKAEIYPYVVQDAVVRNEEGQSGGVVFRGITRERLERILKFQNFEVPVARMIPGANEVIVGNDLAVNIGVYSDSDLTVIPPETLLMPAGTQQSFTKVKVHDIFETGVNDIDGKTAFFILGESLGPIAKSPSRLSGVEIVLQEAWQAEDVQKLLIEKGIATETWAERNSAILKSLKIEKIMIGVFVGLSALIAGFSLVGVSSLLLTQKRKDLGVLMSLGLARSKVLRMYTFVSFGLAGFAIVAGALLATALAWVLNAFPLNVLPPIYQDRSIPAEINPQFIVIVVGSALFIALLASYWSVRFHIKGREPVDLLRRTS